MSVCRFLGPASSLLRSVFCKVFLCVFVVAGCFLFVRLLVWILPCSSVRMLHRVLISACLLCLCAGQAGSAGCFQAKRDVQRNCR